MLKQTLFLKLIPILLIVSILFTACKIPDISKFTEASAQMTQAINTGIKETDLILEEASTRKDLFDSDTRTSLEIQLENYRKAAEPTVKSLKALDGYLEALNSLAKAQADSKKDSEAAVTAVSNLASAVAGINVPNTVISLGSRLVNLANTLKLKKDFKERVILVEEIVNGGSADSKTACSENTFKDVEEKLQAKLNQNPDTKSNIDKIDTDLTKKEKEINEKITPLKEKKKNLEKQRKDSNNELEQEKLSAEINEIENKIKKLEPEKESASIKAAQDKDKIYNKAFVNLSGDEREKLEQEINNNSCGVIDILKINMKYLKRIYRSVADNIYATTRDKNIGLIGYHDNIVLNDNRVQRELSMILEYDQRILELSQYQNIIDLGLIKKDDKDTQDEIVAKKKEIKTALQSVFIQNRILQVLIEKECDKDEICKAETETTAPRHQLIITQVFDNQEKSLLVLNKQYTDDLQRINPAYSKVMDELNRIKNKQSQMNKLFNGSIEALDTWGETHSNLRNSLTTKRPLTVSRLVSSASFLWEILKPSETSKN